MTVRPTVSGPADTPGILEFLLDFGDGNCLVAGVHIGQAAHVAGALHVVLPAQRIDAAARNAHVAAQHRQVGGRLDIVYTGGVLGDAHGIYDGSWFAFGIGAGYLADAIGRDAADFRDFLWSVLSNQGLQRFEIFGALGDEGLVLPALR